MSKVWTERIEAIRADPLQSRRAAALYYLVECKLRSPVQSKRRSPEDLLMDEAINIVDMSDKELERARIAEEEKAWQAWEKKS